MDYEIRMPSRAEDETEWLKGLMDAFERLPRRQADLEIPCSFRL
jgi:hypothetical protein